jgi:hypothetical protein
MTPAPFDASVVIAPTAPTVSDTFAYQPGLQLYVEVGGTATTVTVVVPGSEPFSGGPKDDLVFTSISNTKLLVNIPQVAADSTGVVTVTYSQVTAVLSRLLKRDPSNP